MVSDTPPGSGQPQTAVNEPLATLGWLSQQLSGSFEPAAISSLLAEALTRLLAPDQLVLLLLEPDANRLDVAAAVPGGALPDDPLAHLGLRQGPLVFSDDVAGQAGRRGVEPRVPVPASWLGAPLLIAGRRVGAVSLGRNAGRPPFGQPDATAVQALLAQAAIALENARLVHLLSIGKREWEQTVDAIRQAMCIVDAEGVIRRGNLAFANLTRVPVTALPGRPWLTVLPTEWTAPIGRALATAGTGAATVELRKDASILTVTALTLGAPEGSAVLMFEDQTETRRLQEQLIQSEKMSAIGQLIAGVAHELNNPLTSVVGFTDYLSESGDIPRHLAEPFSVIRQEAERAATIVRNLLGFARKQEGRRSLHRVEAILKSTLMLMRNQWMGQQLEVALEVEPNLPSVEVDANQVQQVFVNLLNNAAQAIATKGGGGHITIRARRWLDGVAVSVVDDGPGVPEANATRVFEPFWTTKPEGQGTGLGLAVSQGIVREHSGRITHEPTPGGGATFTVELPSAAGQVEARATRDSGPHKGNLQILVVDDEPHILHYLRATLEAWGHAVTTADDGYAALEAAGKAPFDLAICDLRMPNLGGREFYEGIIKLNPALGDRVIFATGDTVRGDTLSFLEGLGRPFLHKPFTLAELREVLGRYAGSRALAR